MNINVITCTALAVISTTSLHATYKVNIDAGSPRQGLGGEFEMTALAGGSSDWSSIGLSEGTMWDSFCLEESETISLNGNYWATLDNVAIKGGNGGQDPVGSDQDPLSKGTAWLFRQHWDLGGAAGDIGDTLGNVDIDFVSYGTDSDALELQNAIWWLEDEIDLNNQPENNKYLKVALGNIGGTYDELKDDAGVFEFGVGVLNLWNHNPELSTFSETSHFKQSQLVVVPEPSAILGSLFGIGMIGYAGFRRRKATASQGS